MLSMTVPDRQAGRPAVGWRWCVLIFGVALAWRLVYLGVARVAPDFATPYLDARWHVQWATAIANGHLVGHTAFFRAPLYPYVLGALFALLGPNLLLARLAQIVLGAVSASLVGVLGTRLFGRPTGILAGLLYASAAPLILFDLEMLLEVVFVPLVVVVLLACERSLRQPSRPAFLALGLALGIAAITRPNILLFVPVATALVAWPLWRQRRRLAPVAIDALFLAAGVAVPIAPVTVYNLAVGHDLVLIASQGGLNFYLGNCAEATGDEAFMPGPTDSATYAPDGTYTDNVMSSGRFLAERALGRALKPSEISRFWGEQAFAWIRAHPLSWARLTASKAFYLVGAFEIGDERNLTASFQEWAPFRFLPRWWWLFPLAVVGAAAPGERRARLLLGAFFVTYGLSVALFFCTERFRLPLYPVVCILAARAVVWLGRELARRRWRHALTSVAGAAAVAIVIAQDPTGYTAAERISAHLLAAHGAIRRGDLASAEADYRAALEMATRWAASHPGQDVRARRVGGRGTAPDLLARARREYAELLEREGRLGEAHALTGEPD